ncbi:MAG: rhamnogalacturonan acetylesterase, partial [Bacteroidales bacterium]|nr:rhamnogalacturonan acetylesterase [Bacteroidales bacterium]
MKPKILSLCAILMAVLFLANTPKADTITIYTIGDSTMANKDTTDGKLERGWAMMLQEFFDESKVVVENHAVNGRSSKSFFEQGRWKPIMDKLKAGDYVFIQFGHNDEKTEDSLRYTDPQTTYKAFLTMYVNDARSKGANPVLLTPIARRTYVKGVKLPIDTHKEYSIAVRQLAKDLDVPMIDMDELSRKLLVQMGDDGAKELYMWVEPGENSNYPDGLKDDTHLNEYGAERMASIAISNLRRLKLPLEKMLLDNVYDENWKDVVFEQPDEWYGTADAQAIAENVLLYQSNIGGWPKNLPLHHKLTEKQRQKLIANKANTKDITL